MSDNTFREMAWDCDKHECFNKKKKLKFGALFNALPGSISFSDVDGITEVHGNALMLEWKGYDEEGAPNSSIIPTAQKIMFERLTRGRMISVICVAGNAEDMSVKYMCLVTDGKFGEWRPATLDDLNKSIKEWTEWSKRHSRL